MLQGEERPDKLQAGRPPAAALPAPPPPPPRRPPPPPRRALHTQVVVASGNSAVDACYVAPANVPEVITVAASNVATKYNGTKAGDPEDIYRWANTGPCVDIFAPVRGCE